MSDIATDVSPKVLTLIQAAMDHDIHTTTTTINNIAQQWGTAGIYATCCALAEAIRILGDYRDAPDGFWGLQVEHRDKGLIRPEDMDEGQAVARASQFLVTRLNGDSAQSLSLFEADLVDGDPDRACLIPAGLSILVGAYGRRKEAQNRAKGGAA